MNDRTETPTWCECPEGDCFANPTEFFPATEDAPYYILCAKCAERRALGTSFSCCSPLEDRALVEPE
jgi:hypothetical protein